MPTPAHLAAALATHVADREVIDTLWNVPGQTPEMLRPSYTIDERTARHLLTRGEGWAEALTARETTPHALLEELTSHPGAQVRQNLAQNPALGLPSLTRMFEDELDRARRGHDSADCAGQAMSVIEALCRRLPAHVWLGPLLAHLPHLDGPRCRVLVQGWVRGQEAEAHISDLSSGGQPSGSAIEDLLEAVQAAACSDISWNDTRVALGRLAAAGRARALPPQPQLVNPTLLAGFATGLLSAPHRWDADTATWFCQAAPRLADTKVGASMAHRHESLTGPVARALASSGDPLCVVTVLCSSDIHRSLGPQAEHYARRWAAHPDQLVRTRMLAHPGMLSFLSAAELQQTLAVAAMPQVNAKAILALPAATGLPEETVTALLEQCSFAGLALWCAGAWMLQATPARINHVARHRFPTAADDAAALTCLVRRLHAEDLTTDTTTEDAARGTRRVADGMLLQLLPAATLIQRAADGSRLHSEYLASRVSPHLGDDPTRWLTFLAAASSYEGDDLDDLCDLVDALHYAAH